MEMRYLSSLVKHTLETPAECPAYPAIEREGATERETLYCCAKHTVETPAQCTAYPAGVRERGGYMAGSDHQIDAITTKYCDFEHHREILKGEIFFLGVS